ncbi:hypothetical protein [Microbacterium kunmingense]|uniref:hypothetical protein n=1 Tax=Microbacterium kunmingense TaxID=2915939 RepID=UPI003D752BDE
MTKRGENRQHTIWDAVNNTVANNPQFIVIVDEAHLGTGVQSTGNATLLTQLMNGTGLMKTKPRVLVGISATAARFEDRIRGTRDIHRSVPIDMEALAGSGLVKDRLLLTHPDEEIAADTTLLAVAARKRREYEELWAAYTRENDEPAVIPALLLQVGAKPSAAEVGELLTTVLTHDQTLSPANIYHTFESHSDEVFGKHVVSYGAPSDLQRITEAKIILAKDAVTTGWDAPRVEVLVSLRGTKDETVITQLIGRAVRQPLAKRVADDRLNAVSIYLPNFRRASVKAVIDRLQQGDDAVTSEVIVEPVPVTPNPDVPPAVWRALRSLPSWTRPQRTARSEVERASRVANILSASMVRPAAAADLETAVVSALKAHLAANRDYVNAKVHEFEEVDYVTHEAAWAGGAVESDSIVSIGATATLTHNILDVFKKGIARYPGASGKQLWVALATADDSEDPEHERLVVAALGTHPDTAKVANDAAASILRSWVKEHMAQLSTAEQADLYTLLEESTAPERVTVQLPVAMQVKPAERSWPKHLLVDAGGRYPDPKSNTWESRVLEVELPEAEDADARHAVAWYRNPTSGRHALAIPYKGGTLYPDFLFFREKDGEVLIDIVDPHRPDIDDTKEKWVALSDYAAIANEALASEDVNARVDRVLAVIEGPDKHLLSVNIAAGPVARAIAGAIGEDAIRGVFEQFGGRYQIPYV